MQSSATTPSWNENPLSARLLRSPPKYLHMSQLWFPKTIATTRLKCELQLIRNLPPNCRCIMSSVLRLRLWTLKRGNSTNSPISCKAQLVPAWIICKPLAVRKTFNPWLALWSAAIKVVFCKVACPRRSKTRVKLIRIIYLKIISTG